MTAISIKHSIAVAIITGLAGVTNSAVANAGSVSSIDTGNIGVCVGDTCLFGSKTTDHRHRDKTVDHRGGKRDHRKRNDHETKNTVIVVEPTVRDHRTKVVVRDHRLQPKVRDHRTDSHQPVRRNTIVKVNGPRYSCSFGANTLIKRGFRAINAFDCAGATYQYSAIRQTKLYRATMNARTGDFEIVMIGFAH